MSKIADRLARAVFIGLCVVIAVPVVYIVSMAAYIRYDVYRCIQQRKDLQSRTDYPQIATACVTLAHAITNDDPMSWRPSDPFVPAILRSLSPAFIDGYTNSINLEFRDGHDISFGYSAEQSGTDRRVWNLDYYYRSEFVSTSKWLVTITNEIPVSEPGLDFLSKIPEFRDLSLKMSEQQLKAHVEKQQLYSKRTVQGDRVSYWLVTPEGENVFVGFSVGKCTGIQRMQPIPKQAIKDAIGASEYEAWMKRRSGTNSTAPP